ncbi:type VI secretion system baseplate subunit TssK [Terriglobus saanensis]|uniref:Type VI secretion protein, VC_A0114 family n=1 Tax=Terriglobus saanensis (strain ATCC BAA-1853 / DSM 23119 / SP1PR4) TaxID=401053 RepID=E8UX25_TERSS|nr:type VI secretion system baseplate subunit TssK [Terriglobus saanensis]ADV81912.1 type VI secretion protein, VC_A0114 family [Terriglobus saanensis SP1PR4]
MRRLQPVAWSKGVFLSPQHLQAQDHFVEDSLRFIVEATSFRFWGFRLLQVDATAITEGSLNLLQASGFFPDGLAFDLANADMPPQSRSLDDCFEDKKHSCVFYFAIPESRSAGINIGQRGSGLSTRFYPELQMLRDENSTGIEKPVSLARKNLKILAEGESLEGSLVLPFARVLRTEAGQYQLDREFIAPMIDANASESLTSILRSLVEVMISLSGRLAGVRRQRNQSLADFSASDVANFWLLYTINTHLPVLHQLLQAPQVHPETVYMHLLTLAGALTTFSKRVLPQDLPKYDHMRQGRCFLALEAILVELLNTVIPSRFLALPLRQLRDSVYVADIDVEEDTLKNSRFYLAIASELPTAELIARTTTLVKACSATHLETLIRQALPGVALTHVPSPPQEIPVKLSFEYFSLDRAGAAWDTIQRARNIGVYVPGEIANPRLELILLPPVGTKPRG